MTNERQVFWVVLLVVVLAIAGFVMYVASPFLERDDRSPIITVEPGPFHDLQQQPWERHGSAIVVADDGLATLAFVYGTSRADPSIVISYTTEIQLTAPSGGYQLGDTVTGTFGEGRWRDDIPLVDKADINAYPVPKQGDTATIRTDRSGHLFLNWTQAPPHAGITPFTATYCSPPVTGPDREPCG